MESRRKKSIAATKEYNDTLELIDFSEALCVIAKQADVIKKIQQEIQVVSSSVWNKIAEIYQDKFEKAVGETANLLWVAMRSGGSYVPILSRSDLPKRFEAIVTPDSKDCETLRTRLWNEFVGAD